jgi:hypothetical protein
MKLFAKILVATALGGAMASVYAAPGGLLTSPYNTNHNEMVSQAAGIQQQIYQDYRFTQHLQQIARKEKDVIKLSCVNDKIVEMKPEMNIADRFRTEFQISQNGDERIAFHAIVQAGDTVHRLREAAEQCIGEPLLATDQSNDYTHPLIPDNPNTNPYGNGIEPPVYASPFQ